MQAIGAFPALVSQLCEPILCQKYGLCTSCSNLACERLAWHEVYMWIWMILVWFMHYYHAEVNSSQFCWSQQLSLLLICYSLYYKLIVRLPFRWILWWRSCHALLASRCSLLCWAWIQLQCFFHFWRFSHHFVMADMEISEVMGRIPEVCYPDKASVLWCVTAGLFTTLLPIHLFFRMQKESLGCASCVSCSFFFNVQEVLKF